VKTAVNLNAYVEADRELLPREQRQIQNRIAHALSSTGGKWSLHLRSKTGEVVTTSKPTAFHEARQPAGTEV